MTRAGSTADVEEAQVPDTAAETDEKTPWRGDPADRRQQEVAADEHVKARVEQQKMNDAAAEAKRWNTAWNDAKKRRDAHLSVQKSLRFGDDEVLGILRYQERDGIGADIPPEEDRKRGH